MRFVQTLLRPIYRAFFERPLWWFLAKVKAFFFAETLARLESIERRLSEDVAGQRQWAAIEARLRAAEASNGAQWDTIEQLILALFQQPERRISDSAWKADAQCEPQGLSVPSAYGVNGPDTIR